MGLQSIFPHFAFIAVMFEQCLGLDLEKVDIDFSAHKTIDSNECLASPCDSNAYCENTLGSFTCKCNNGFIGNGFSCTEINQCDPDIICSSPVGGTCRRNGFRSYSCFCNTGYTGPTCVDVNECLASPCNSNAHCENTPGSFTCKCNHGFVGDGFSCADLNLCKPDIICSSPDGGTCKRNGFRSYTCDCNTGYTGPACVDLIECLAFPCDSNAHCKNTPGSFTCTCNHGFVGDGFSCEVDQTKVTLKNTTSSASATNSTLSKPGISLRANISLTGNDSSNIQDRNDFGLVGTIKNDFFLNENYVAIISGFGGAILFVLLSVLLFLIFEKGKKTTKKPIYKGSQIAGKNNSTYGSVTPNITKRNESLAFFYVHLLKESFVTITILWIVFYVKTMDFFIFNINIRVVVKLTWFEL